MEKKFCCAVLGLLCLLALAGCEDVPENAVPYSEEAKGPTGIVIFSARPMQSPINRRTDGFTDGNIIKEKYETDRKTAKMRRGLNTDLAAFLPKVRRYGFDMFFSSIIPVIPERAEISSILLSERSRFVIFVSPARGEISVISLLLR